ncbi:MAG: TIGR00730 family Rossman fold protein [Vampirovibrionales bacterium]
MMMSFKVCVYCASSNTLADHHYQITQQLGRSLAQHHMTLVYGGGNAGLMGTVANAVLDEGGHVIGVIPHKLASLEYAHHGINELYFVDTMYERKQMMTTLADAFVVLPGGFGTFEELFEIWTASYIGFHNKPIILVNHDNFYQPLMTWLEGLVPQGFVKLSSFNAVTLVNTVEEAMALLEKANQSHAGN